MIFNLHFIETTLIGFLIGFFLAYFQPIQDLIMEPVRRIKWLPNYFKTASNCIMCLSFHSTWIYAACNIHVGIIEAITASLIAFSWERIIYSFK